MAITPQEFYKQTYGKAFDVDNHYGYQCWDAMAYFCTLVGIPTGVIYCAITGYVQDIWELRNSSGILKYFDAVQPPFKDGDWVIWGRDYNMTPKSHVAMYYQGKAYGQSQNGIKAFNNANLDFNKALGGFRWKEWSDGKVSITLKDGIQSVSYNGATISVTKAYGDYKGMCLGAIQAGKEPHEALQDIKTFDHKNMIIFSMGNLNYFQNDTKKSDFGQHYGVEQVDGDGINSTENDFILAPKGDPYHIVYQLKDGTVGHCSAKDYWYKKSDVLFACTPYAVVVADGKACNYRSTGNGNKENTKAEQTLIMMVDKKWCIACTTSLVLPSFMQSFALACGAEIAFLMDSGGSTQKMDFINGKWTPTIYTGRKIPNVFVLAKWKDEQPQPSPEPTPEPEEETVPKSEYDALKNKYDMLNDEYSEVSQLSEAYKNKLNQIKKIVEG